MSVHVRPSVRPAHPSIWSAHPARLSGLFYGIIYPGNFRALNISYLFKPLHDQNKKINYIDCSQIRLLEFCSIVLKSSFYVGNDSGPLNLSAILGVKSFNLIGPTSASVHKLPNIIVIKSKYYDGEVEKDATKKVYLKPREIMKGISVEDVLDKIIIS